MESCKNSATFASEQPSQSTVFDEGNERFFAAFKTYVLQNHMSDLVRILLEDEINVHYCLKIDGSDLLENHFILTEMLFFNPEKVLKIFDRAFHAATCIVFGNHNLKTHMTLKTHLHVRFTKLPSCSEIWRDRVPKSIDIGRFLVMEGTVIRTSSAKILEYKKEYMCSKCKNLFSLEADFQLHYAVPTPTTCPVNANCNGKKFVVVTGNDGTTGPKKCKDYQEIRVQEQVRKLSMGTIPRSLTVVLEDDLVDSCKPGDDIIIFGSVMCRWHPFVTGKPCDIELVLKANNIEVCNERHASSNGIDFAELHDEFQCFWASHTEETMMKARNHILASLCPQVYGLYVVKLAVALVLAGGVPRVDPSGSRVRGECHLLLVGDPGTGKSQFLKYAAKVTPRSVLTTGIGSSTAGLTVSAIRDGPHWTLEAGALVLADGGICCIDEFSGIKEQDRSAIHEAMEQQTISVAKAGLVCKLNTRTSILAATNPKLGKYDEASSVAFNIAMASPLLSRFDLVLVLIDEKNLHWDSVVADYLLLGDTGKRNMDTSGLWSLDQMQAYFGIIRQINPIVSSEADQVLRAYYRRHRQADCRNAARTTIRLLESLIRLSEAHARLMFRHIVTIQDAIAAVTVVESSMQGGSLLPTGSILHSCFPKDADLEYVKHAHLVLQCLNLENLFPKGIPVPTQNQPCTQIENQSLLSHRNNASPAHLPCANVAGSADLPNIDIPPTLNASIFSQSCQKSSASPAATDQNPTKRQSHNIQLLKTTNKREAGPNVDNRSNVFRLDPAESEAMFNFDFDSEDPPMKRSISANSPSVDASLSFSATLSTEVNATVKNSNNFSSTWKYPIGKTQIASPSQSQISLFSIDPISTPRTQSKAASFKKLCGQGNSFLKHNKGQNKLFHLPESESDFMFCDTMNNILNSDESGRTLASDTSVKNIATNLKSNVFAGFTLDPSIIEDMCGDFDL